MTKLAIINGRLIDGTGEEARENHALLIANGLVDAIGATGSLTIPSDAEIIDAAGATVMPGLIDAHTHLTYHRSEYSLILQQQNESLETNTIKATENARIILETGCTAIGDGGWPRQYPDCDS